MPSKVRRSRSDVPRRKGSRSALAPRPVPYQLAVRWAPGAESRVRAALSPLGDVEPYKPARILILHRRPRTSRVSLAKTLDRLREQRSIEFVTPVLRDPAGTARQVLTDEITVRFKPDAAVRRTLASLRAEHGLQVARRNEFVRTQFIVRLPHTSGTRTLALARSLHRRDDVEFAAPNYITEIHR